MTRGKLIWVIATCGKKKESAQAKGGKANEWDKT